LKSTRVPNPLSGSIVTVSSACRRLTQATSALLINQASQRLGVLKQRRPDIRPEMLRLAHTRLMLRQGDAAGGDAIMTTLRNTHVLGP